MKVDKERSVFDGSEAALDQMAKEQEMPDYYDLDLLAFNDVADRAVRVLDNTGCGGKYVYIVIGAYCVGDGQWVPSYYNDELKDAIDAMEAANTFLVRGTE